MAHPVRLCPAVDVLMHSTPYQSLMPAPQRKPLSSHSIQASDDSASFARNALHRGKAAALLFLLWLSPLAANAESAGSETWRTWEQRWWEDRTYSPLPPPDPYLLRVGERRPSSGGPGYARPHESQGMELPPGEAERCFDLSALGPLPFDLQRPLEPALLNALQLHCGPARRLTVGWIRRAGRLRAWMESELTSMQAPLELFWVAIVESALDPLAVSHAGAAGPWQFMAPTGRERGLQINPGLDERFDLEASTRAAVPYLLELRERFGHWGLALAAYNAGEGHVRGEIRRHNANDFWRMDTFGALFPGARAYALRIKALAIIDRYPEAFGIHDVEPEAAWNWEVVHVPRSVRLSLMAQAAGVPLDDLRALNGALRRPETPGGAGTYPLRFPEGSAATFVANYDRLAERYGDQHEVFTLRTGETVADLARHWGFPERVLRAISDLPPSGAIAPGTEILVPLRGRRPEATLPTSASARPVVIAPQWERPRGRTLLLYDVVPGDTAARLAAAFQVSVDELVAWNDLDPNARLWSAMTLAIWAPQNADLSHVVYTPAEDVLVLERGSEAHEAWQAQEARRRATQRVQRHTVRSGETVGAIARRYGVRTADIVRWNDLDANASIRAGQSLIVRR